MKPIFIHIKTLQYRFILAMLFSFSIMLIDSQLNILNQIRMYIDTSISPLYILSNKVYKLLDFMTQIFTSCSQLRYENDILHKQLLISNNRLLKLDKYRRENIYLRKLLNSPLYQNEYRIVTQAINNINYPYNNQIVIDKGSVNGVYEGQPVINDKGIVGQVISVSKLTSRVLLICDSSHAIPIQVLSNDVHMIAYGRGCDNDLQIKYSSTHTDIHVGDLLVASGLDGHFPKYYPVATVTSVKLDRECVCTIIEARPTACLQQLDYLLLIWKSKFNDNNLK